MLQSELANVGVPLLFALDEMTVTLQPGVSEYTLPASVIAPLDAYVRVYQRGTAQNFAPVITGAAGDMLATVTQAAHGFAAGSMVFFSTAIAASGQVIQGTYLVTSVIDFDNYQIGVPTPMDGTNSVALPVFSTTAGSSSLQIVLANHGLSVGKSFYCNVPVTVGGRIISGKLVVTGVTDQDTFTVGIGSGASSTASATMNSGLAQAQPQVPGLDPVDYVMTQVSRNDYIAQPDKGPNLQFRQSTFWVDRKINPIVRFWTAPDDAAPYVFHLFYMRQPDDPVVSDGVGIQFPFRWWACYSAGIAKNLARKYPMPPSGGVTVADLVTEYKELLEAALMEDIERVPAYVSPGMRGYFG
jgi:hypothetical protein